LGEPVSSLGKRIRSTGQQLLAGAEKQIESYRTRFDQLDKVYDTFLKDLINVYADQIADTEFVDRFFGKRTLRFAGVDGTLYKKPTFDLIVFFGGAYAAEGIVLISDDGELQVEYEEQYLNRGLSVSSVLPVFINEVRIIDQSILVRDEYGEVDVAAGRPDQWVVDNTAFADYIMGLAEFYVGYALVTRDKPVDILLMDRIMSAELSSFYAETSPSRVDLDHESGLIGADAGGRPLTKTDWAYARRLFGNPALNTPPPRGEFLLPRVVRELLAHGAMTRDEIMQVLDLQGGEWEKRLDAVLKEGLRARDDVGPVLKRKKDRYYAVPQLRGLEDRVRTLLDDVCGRIFSDDETILYDERFKINGKWLTTSDLAFLSLMALFQIMRACWSNPTLLVGVAKDSSARDMKNQLLPVLNHVARFQGGFSAVAQDVPDTDRMILQWVSLREHERLGVPWATIEYDTAFKTVVPHFSGKEGLVSGARRNQISLNMTFVKAYFQLTRAKSDPRLRSNVLLYDRLIYPEFDTGEDRILVLRHDYGMTVEPVETVLYLEACNPVQQFIITLFKKMTATSVPELFGHIKPLYIADKIAKYYYDQHKRMIDSAHTWLAARPELREMLFYLGTFRERRSDIEHTRKYS